MRSLEMVINNTSDEILSPMTPRWRVEAEGTDDNLSGSGANACASSSRRNYLFFGPEDAYRSRLRKFSCSARLGGCLRNGSDGTIATSWCCPQDIRARTFP